MGFGFGLADEERREPKAGGFRRCHDLMSSIPIFGRRLRETRRRGRETPGRGEQWIDAVFAKMWTVLRRFPDAAVAMAEALGETKEKDDESVEIS